VPDYVRSTTFDADEAGLEALLEAINSSESPPPGVPATHVTVLADRALGRVRIVTRFGSEEDLHKGGEALDAITPTDTGLMKRVTREIFEVVLERQLT
jgi:hypothetical protein